MSLFVLQANCLQLNLSFIGWINSLSKIVLKLVRWITINQVFETSSSFSNSPWIAYWRLKNYSASSGIYHAASIFQKSNGNKRSTHVGKLVEFVLFLLFFLKMYYCSHQPFVVCVIVIQVYTNVWLRRLFLCFYVAVPLLCLVLIRFRPTFNFCMWPKGWYCFPKKEEMFSICSRPPNRIALSLFSTAEIIPCGHEF